MSSYIASRYIYIASMHGATYNQLATYIAIATGYIMAMV